MTNSATGTVWYTPPAGTTNGIVTDTSGLPSPYVSVVRVIRKDLMSWCGTNSVSFPATSTKQYKVIIYIVSGAPTNGTPITASVEWNP